MDKDEYIELNGVLYRRVSRAEVRSFQGCPRCGSERLITKPGDESFYPRMGCLSCNRWIQKPELR